MWGPGGLREGRTPLWTVGKLSQELRIGREYIAWVTLLSFHFFLADQKCKSRNKGLIGFVGTWFLWKGSLKTTATSLTSCDKP